MTSVGEDFPKQQARVRKIQERAKAIGPEGTFLYLMCDASLREAEQAAISGDIVRILTAYNDLKSFKE